MAVATYLNPTTVAIQGPRDGHISYYWQVPSGTTVTDHAYFGPIDGGAGYGVVWAVSAGVSSGAEKPAMTVLGTYDSSTFIATPSARDWFTCRGDTSTGANVVLSAVNGGPVKILTPARSYRLRVSAGTANVGATTAMNVRCFVYKGQNW